MIFIIAIFNFFLKAFVIMNLWNWFLVPLGVTSISFVLALGFSLFINIFTYNITLLLPKVEPSVITQVLLQSTSFLLLTYLLGYVISIFI